MARYVPKLPPKRSAWAEELGSEGLLNARSNLSVLQMLAEHLTTYHCRPGWRDAEAILLEPDLDRAARAFNRLAERIPFRLKVAVESEHMRLTIRRGRGAWIHRGQRAPIAQLAGPTTDEGRAVRYLWAWFQEPDRHRLKRCPECKRWFVDVTRPGNSLRCSTSCTTNWWNMKRAKMVGGHS